MLGQVRVTGLRCIPDERRVEDCLLVEQGQHCGQVVHDQGRLVVRCGAEQLHSSLANMPASHPTMCWSLPMGPSDPMGEAMPNTWRLGMLNLPCIEGRPRADSVRKG